MEIRLILTTFVVSFGFSPVHPNNHQAATELVTNVASHGLKVGENFRHFFDSIKKSDEEKTKTYRTILEEDALNAKRAFDTMKEELQSARQKNADKQRNFNKDDGISIPKAVPLSRGRRALGPADSVTRNYCEYEGRFVRRGAQKYIPELDKVVLCRSVKPRWISVYVCSVLLNTPEKYMDITGRLLMAITKLCETKPGASSTSSAGPPETETHTNSVAGLHGRQDPLTPSSIPSQASGKAASIRRKTTLWDGDLNSALKDSNFHATTLRKEEAALRAAGLWFTTAAGSVDRVTDDHQEPAISKTLTHTSRRMQYPKTTLPTFDDMDLAEASPFFVKTKKSSTAVAGVPVEDSETESSFLDSESDIVDDQSADMRVFDEDKQRELDLDIGLDVDVGGEGADGPTGGHDEASRNEYE